MIYQKFHCLCPEVDEVPGFTSPTPGAAQENTDDESLILADQDQTRNSDNLPTDEPISHTPDALENEPGDFVRGEVDVKEQMDRAADAMDASIHGWESQQDEDSPRGDLGASFRDTPGGLEEVEEKTDEDLARMRGAGHRH